MGILRIPVIVLLILGNETGLVLSKCVLRGVCNTLPSGMTQQCLYDGPPQPLDQESLKILKRWCPSFYNGNDTLVCCDSEQLRNLEDQAHAMQSVFGRCPSCMENLIKLTCYSTCDPQMSDYLQVTDIGINEKTLSRYVTGINEYCTSQFMDGAYKACSQVALPSMSKLALDATCGVYTSSQCNPTRWFEFLGDPDINVAAPMRVSFKRQDTMFLGFKPLNVSAVKCNEVSELFDNSSTCSCIDCMESCPASHHYPSTEIDFRILGSDGIVIIVIIIYIIFIIVVIIFKWYDWVRGDKALQKRKERQVPRLHPNQISVSFLNLSSDHIDRKMEEFFFKWGKCVAAHPTLVIALSSWVVAICCYGFQYLDITSDPVKIWASPSSQSRIEKDYFEEKFEPFYRTEQIFLKALNFPKIQHQTASGLIEFGPAFHKEFLLSVIDLQSKIEAIPGFKDVCYAPLSKNGVIAETASQCTVMSFYGYFSNDLSKLNATSIDKNNYTVNYLDHLYKCLKSEANTDCLAPYGGTVLSALAVGGFLKYGYEAYEKADAILLTFLLNNHLDEKQLKPALEWENKFIDLLQEWIEKEKPDYMDVSFRAEISVEKEIAKESQAEVMTVVISYLCMFVYISLALGSYRSWKTFLIDSKIMLGLGGIVVVMASVIGSLGIFGYIGTPTTMLTMEVIPFLLLAVGVDNMFLIVHTSARVMDANTDIVICVANSLSKIGPSLLLTTLSEAACFAIGTVVDMPAVRTFALYAMVAIVINFLLQMTVFIAFLSLDLKRSKSRRYDIFCCLSGNEGNINSINNNDNNKAYSWVESFIENISSIVLKKHINLLIFFVFITFFFACIAMIRFIEPGLDQKLSMPEDSYLTKYFTMMDEVLSMGPNVYFVLKPGLNFSKEEDQNLICGGLRCNVDSLSTQIYSASKQKEITYLRTSASSWIDDYYDWATIDGCCKIYPNGTFCPHNSNDPDCIGCPVNKSSDGRRPQSDSFRSYLTYFLEDNPDAACAKAGHAAYGQAVTYELDMTGKADILDTYFMAYHTTLKTSEDYYNALRMARYVATNITKMLNKNRDPGEEVEVFPYSIFYVYYEQYLTIWFTMITCLIYSFAAVFVVTFIFTSFDIISSLIVLVTVIMIVVDLAALMYMWGITLNAITLVNLVVAVGISVEFCSHIVHSFNLSSEETRKKRAKYALIKTGSSVFAGITLTKILGITVLAFSKTQVFRVFYFRMYLGMVLFGAAHGLIFLPVLLSYLGPNNKQKLLLRKIRKSQSD